MTPSLSQVLAQGGAAAHTSINPLFLLAGLGAFFLAAAFSAVKGLELYRRRLLPRLLDEAPPLAEIQNHEEAEKLSFLTGQNHELQGKILELSGVLNNVKQTRDVLEKSNLVLVKESTRLKGEKEALLLKACEPLIAVKTGQKTVPAVKLKVAAAKTTKTKKGDRRPKRVSRKAK